MFFGFIFIPTLQVVLFGMLQKGDDLRKFMQLDEILLIDGYPRYQQLLSIAENCMQIVCQGKGDPVQCLLSYSSNITHYMEFC